MYGYCEEKINVSQSHKEVCRQCTPKKTIATTKSISQFSRVNNSSYFTIVLLRDVTYETGEVDSWKLKEKNAMNNNLIEVARYLGKKKICCLETIIFWH